MNCRRESTSIIKKQRKAFVKKRRKSPISKRNASIDTVSSNCPKPRDTTTSHVRRVEHSLNRHSRRVRFLGLRTVVVTQYPINPLRRGHKSSDNKSELFFLSRSSNAVSTAVRVIARAKTYVWLRFGNFYYGSGRRWRILATVRRIATRAWSTRTGANEIGFACRPMLIGGEFSRARTRWRRRRPFRGPKETRR